MISEPQPELPHLGLRSTDCDIPQSARSHEVDALRRNRDSALDTCPILSTRSIEAATLFRRGNSPLSAPELASGRASDRAAG